MSRAKRKRIERANGTRRTPADLRIVRDYIRRGICPCESGVDNPGEHIETCSWRVRCVDDGLPF